ncbi:MAG: hypothetical protein KAS32_10170 [Candidatus Peribacteraceae bacterium]|nr:hypothetical protein [Candidatus Peribacteraceae bacterium]
MNAKTQKKKDLRNAANDRRIVARTPIRVKCNLCGLKIHTSSKTVQGDLHSHQKGLRCKKRVQTLQERAKNEHK